MHYIYKITNLLNNGVYIGQTMHENHRWSSHKWQASNPAKSTQYIHRAMAKYGVTNFTFEVIAMTLTQDNANEIETILISQCDSCNYEKGYNILPGGNNISGSTHPNYGKTHSKESRAKMSAIMKQKCADGWVQETIFKPGAPITQYWKGKESPNKGRIASEETKQKISAAGKGRISHRKGMTGIYSEETLQKMSDSSKGQRRSPETEFKKGSIPHNKGKKLGPAWNRGHFKTLPDDQMLLINKLILEGKSLRKISKITSINRQLIAKILKRNQE